MSVGLGLLGFQTLPKLQVPVQILQSQEPVSSATTESQNNTSSSTISGDNISKSANEQRPQKPPSWNLQVRCPFDFTDRRQNEKEKGDSITGVHRVSRHPGLWALGLTCCGNGFLQPTFPLSIFMMGPLAVAMIGGAHTDSRYRRNLGGSVNPAYMEATSNVPFLAMLLGKQGNQALSQWLEELKGTNVAVGLLVACGFVASRGRAATNRAATAALRSSASSTSSSPTM
jgi:prenyl protein peptidase